MVKITINFLLNLKLGQKRAGLSIKKGMPSLYLINY
jgi:hypothetical protein